MIKSIRLKNFQGHKDTEIVFSPGFNLLVGPSDHGKSSVIRAIDWVRTDQPKGKTITGFIHRGMEEIKVSLTTEKNVITRKRDRKDTGSYSTDDGDVFSAMGSVVPMVVNDILGMSDINVQLQLDTHFLILETAGRAASFINKITKLDKIDEGLSLLKSMKSTASKKIGELGEDLDKTEGFLESGICAAHEDLLVLKKDLFVKSAERSNISTKMREVGSTVEQLELLEVEQEAFKGLGNIRKTTDSIGDGIEELEKLSSSIRELKIKVNELSDVTGERKSAQFDMDTLLHEKKMIERKVTACPYCGSVLTEKTKDKLLGMV